MAAGASSMGLRRIISEQVTRGRILEAAAAVFARKGVSAATVEDILATAGLSRRTFYQFFKSKEEALEGLFELAVDTLLATLRSAAQEPGTPEVKLERAVDAFLALQQTGGPIVGILHAEAIRPGSLLASHRERALDAVCTVMDDTFHAVSGSRVDPLVYRALVIALEGVVIHLHRGGAFGAAQASRAKNVMLPILRRVLALPGSEVPELPAARS